MPATLKDFAAVSLVQYEREAEGDVISPFWANQLVPEAINALVNEVERLQYERAELRELAKKVRDYWRANPGHTKDGISTPGMMLLMAVEKP